MTTRGDKKQNSKKGDRLLFHPAFSFVCPVTSGFIELLYLSGGGQRTLFPGVTCFCCHLLLEGPSHPSINVGEQRRPHSSADRLTGPGSAHPRRRRWSCHFFRKMLFWKTGKDALCHS